MQNYKPALSLQSQSRTTVLKTNAEVAQLVEHHLAKVRVAGSSLVFRSNKNSKPSVVWNFLFTHVCIIWCRRIPQALVVELVDAQDLKSCFQQWECGFKSRPGHREKPINFDRFFHLVQHRYNKLNFLRHCYRTFNTERTRIRSAHFQFIRLFLFWHLNPDLLLVILT